MTPRHPRRPDVPPAAPTRTNAHPERPPTAERSGAWGEALAARGLAAIGYRIVARNLRTRAGEIDLLVRRGRLWVAVEVKTRRDHPAPERCIAPTQLDRVANALAALAPDLRPRPRALRIDVVAITWHHRSPRTERDVQLWHFPGFRRLTPPTDPLAFQADAEVRGGRAPIIPTPRCVPTLLPTMPTHADKIIPRRKALLMVSEHLIFALLVLVGTSVPPLCHQHVDLLSLSSGVRRGLLTASTIAILCQAALSYNDLYDWKTAQNRAELANRLLHSYGYTLLVLGCLALLAPQLFWLPGVLHGSGETWKLILLLGIAFFGVFAFRHAFHWFFYKWRFGERILVLGSGPDALQLARMVRDNPMAGYEMVGIVEEHDQPPLGQAAGDLPLGGSIADLRRSCREQGIARVVVALRERRGKVPTEELLACRMDGVVIEEREAMYERLTGKLAVESMRPSYLIYGRGFAKDPLTMVLKRVLDILASSIGLALSLPLCLVTAIVVKATSRGPVFFTQVRVGEDGQTFRLIKFRTMQADAEKHSGPVWAQRNDARVTKVGRFLRLTRIDEVPQFLNILAGQMSFVGPRPERPHFVEQLQREIPFYPLRHAVKPGLTGWAQVCHRYAASTEDAQEKLRYDLYYIKNMGLLFDLNIIMRTVMVILRGTGR